jgi:hypothetical protein
MLRKKKVEPQPPAAETGSAAPEMGAGRKPCPEKEMDWYKKQRKLDFERGPDDDCRVCKFFDCRRKGEACENFYDCFVCPARVCKRAEAGSWCGFEGRRNQYVTRSRAEENAGEVTVRGVRFLSVEEYAEDRACGCAEGNAGCDCFFCKVGGKCQLEGGPAGCEVPELNCYECPDFFCEIDPDDYELPETCPKAPADEDGEGGGEAAGDDDD